jgi:hypothetical protein
MPTLPELADGTRVRIRPVEQRFGEAGVREVVAELPGCDRLVA